MTLDDEDIERLAARMVELLRELEPRPGKLVDVATVAAQLAVSQAFVRAHATELGGRQLVPGGPWRFALEIAFRAGCVDVAGSAGPTSRPRRRAGAPTRAPERSDDIPLLPVRGAQ